MITPEAIDSLTRSDAYDHPASDVQLIQTHISWVLLAGDFAYKLKKPVRFGFLDYSTLSLRKEMCEREVALNRRTCPAAYIGVVPVVERDGATYLFGPGRTLEYAVKMRRLSGDGWLSSWVDRGDASADLLRGVAESLHAFHAAAASGDEIARYGSAREVAAIWHENLGEIDPFAGTLLPPEALRDIANYGERFLQANRRLMDERASAGRTRDGHGDVRCDSIYVEPDGQVCMTDCIEFSDRLRCGDVASDVAFLSMDLDFRGRPDLSNEFAGRYVELSSGDETVAHMLPFLRCHRALVRAKVECITTREAEVESVQIAESRERALRYVALARSYATDDAPQALFVLGGLSGTGKSHLAAALAARIGAVLVRSDAVRRAMHAAPGGSTVELGYGHDARVVVYEAARERVQAHLEFGRSVVFDATHIERSERDNARALASRLGLPLLLIWVNVAEDLVRARLAKRDLSPDRVSDARWETYLAQRTAMDPLSEIERRDAIEVDGAEPATVNLATIVERNRTSR
ncbi:MAG TPA: AAA family ATPase [Dehalococcoidia bacterium]